MRALTTLRVLVTRRGEGWRGRVVPMVALCAAVLFSAPPQVAQAHRAVTSGPWLGVVGHWADSTMGTAGVVANGERWSGTTARDALERASTRLFGGIDATFVSNGLADGAFPVAVHEPTRSFTSGTLRVQFNLLGGKSDQFAGILFGLTPRGEYYAGRYNTKDGNLAVWQFRNGERRVLARATTYAQLPLNTWQTLEVTITGRQVRVSLAGHPDLALTHTLDADPAGRVGLWVKRDAVTAFRRFEVAP